MRIGVLALQGAFIEHINILKKIGIESIELRKKSDLDNEIDGLILPGGESTVMGKLLHELDMFDILKEKIENGLPTFGTCAGMILLAKNIENDDKVHFATMDISVIRNAFGRQYDSFNTISSFNNELVEMPFIRAPYISEVSSNVEILSTVNDNIVAARQNNQLVCAFHPELTSNTYVHEYFINMIK